MSAEADRLTHERLRLDAIRAEMRRDVAAGAGSGRGFAGICVVASAGLMSLPAVCARLRVSRITLWRMVKRGEFPRPVPTEKRRSLWRGLEVNEWCKANAAHFERVLARRLPIARTY